MAEKAVVSRRRALQLVGGAVTACCVVGRPAIALAHAKGSDGRTVLAAGTDPSGEVVALVSAGAGSFQICRLAEGAAGFQVADVVQDVTRADFWPIELGYRDGSVVSTIGSELVRRDVVNQVSDAPRESATEPFQAPLPLGGIEQVEIPASSDPAGAPTIDEPGVLAWRSELEGRTIDVVLQAATAEGDHLTVATALIDGERHDMNGTAEIVTVIGQVTLNDEVTFALHRLSGELETWQIRPGGQPKPLPVLSAVVPGSVSVLADGRFVALSGRARRPMVLESAGWRRARHNTVGAARPTLASQGDVIAVRGGSGRWLHTGGALTELEGEG
jgi:hypothetical protein